MPNTNSLPLRPYQQRAKEQIHTEWEQGRLRTLLVPVSYTHLDVYKRQALGKAGSKANYKIYSASGRPHGSKGVFTQKLPDNDRIGHVIYLLE